MDNLEHCFTVNGLSETWLNPTYVSAYGTSGYNHVHRTRSTRKSGGVSLFVSEKYLYSEMAKRCMVNDYFESLFVKITNNGMAFVIGIAYRPLNFDIVKFTETLNDILGQISHMPWYIMGDYNIDLAKNELHSPNEKCLVFYLIHAILGSEDCTTLLTFMVLLYGPCMIVPHKWTKICWLATTN